MPTEFNQPRRGTGEVDPALERLVHEELRKLSARKAPETLMPRVLATIQARAARPWWQQSWWQWPLLAQAALVIFACSIIVALSGGGIFVTNQAGAYSDLAWQRTSLLADGFMPLANAGLLLYQKLIQPFLLYILVLAGLLYGGCLGAGTLLFRLTLRRI